jgi:HK97 family phage major capsid protein
MNTNELRDKRARLITEARGMLDGRDTLPADDEVRYQKLFDEAQALGRQIERVEAVEAEARALGESAGRMVRDGMGDEVGTAVPELRSRGLSGIRDEIANGSGFARLRRGMTPAYRAAYRQWLQTGETRALQADLDPAGGYLMAPLQMVDDIIQRIDDAVWVRQLATVYTVMGAHSLGAPKLENDPADAEWTGEVSTVSLDTAMTLGRRELTPRFLAKGIKVSRKLLMHVPNVETLVAERMAYKFAVTMEKAYLTGSGSNQPLGLFTASSAGISTARDVSTDNGATAITGDGLRNAKYALKAQYRDNASWMFHRDAVLQISKIKSAVDGQYIWQQGLQAGTPDRLLGLPVYESEYVPNTFTSAQYVGLIGDLRFYWIADSMAEMELQRLVERYADTNEVGFIGRAHSDGMPVLEDAFARVKLG